MHDIATAVAKGINVAVNLARDPAFWKSCFCEQRRIRRVWRHLAGLADNVRWCRHRSLPAHIGALTARIQAELHFAALSRPTGLRCKNHGAAGANPVMTVIEVKRDVWHHIVKNVVSIEMYQRNLR